MIHRFYLLKAHRVNVLNMLRSEVKNENGNSVSSHNLCVFLEFIHYQKHFILTGDGDFKGKRLHEAIVSAEICKERYRINNLVIDGMRMKATRKFAFSSMCECAFCGTFFSRCSNHQDTQHKKPVWKCRTATNKGIAKCPNSKAVDKNLSTLELKRKKLTDMLLDDKITKEAYDEKYNDFTCKIGQTKEERRLYTSNVDAQKDINKRMKEIRSKLTEIAVLDKFDRVVFESIVEKIIIGEKSADGSVDPYKS